jgi:hypothetical protein
MEIHNMGSPGTPVIIADQFVGNSLTKTSFDLHKNHASKVAVR